MAVRIDFGSDFTIKIRNFHENFGLSKIQDSKFEITQIVVIKIPLLAQKMKLHIKTSKTKKETWENIHGARRLNNFRPYVFFLQKKHTIGNENELAL